MNGIGTVVSVRPGEAEIEVKRESACGMMHEGGCGDCHGCDSALREIRTFMVDPVGVSVGDRVEFSSPSRNILLLSVLVFAVPLLLIIAVYFILVRFFTETWSVVGSIGAGALWFLLLKLFDKPLGTFAKCEILRVVYHEEK